MSEQKACPLTDAVIAIDLPVWAWEIVLQHLNRGAYGDVATVMHEIARQSAPQLLEAQAKAAGEAPAVTTTSQLHHEVRH